jgi:hypothetical protein
MPGAQKGRAQGPAFEILSKNDFADAALRTSNLVAVTTKPIRCKECKVSQIGLAVTIKVSN